MEKQTTAGKVLRFIAIALLGLTAAFHLMGGIGTSCVALFAERWESMAALAPYKWLYILFVLVTVAVSILAIQATVRFARARSGSYRYAVQALVITLMVTAAHVAASQALRGAAAPANMRMYLNILTLIFFLAFYKPLLSGSQPQGSTRSAGSGTGLGAAFVVMGLALLTVQWWAGPTHTWADGVNYADVWHDQLTAAGVGLLLVGAAAALWRPVHARFRRVASAWLR